MADTYAIIEESGGQRKVAADETILIDLYNAGESNAGDTITVDKVLVVGAAGGDAKIGTPHVAGAKVEAEVKKHGRGKKVIVYKFKRRKNYRRKAGHRQPYTALEIKSITA